MPKSNMRAVLACFLVMDAGNGFGDDLKVRD